MKDIIIKYFKIPASVFVTALLMTGCFRDDPDMRPVPAPVEDVVMNLFVPGMTQATRADSGYRDDLISTVDVLVFNGTDGVIIEHKQGRILNSGQNGSVQVSVALKKISGSANMVVVANGRMSSGGYNTNLVAAAYEAAKQAGGSGFTKTTFLQHLIFGSDYPAMTTTTVGCPPLPMYGERTLSPVSPTPVSVSLTRMHAKLDFIVKDSDSDLRQVHLSNMSTQGFVHPGEIVWEPNMPANRGRQTGDFTLGIGSGPHKELTGYFYVMEAPAVDNTSEAAYGVSPAIITELKYEDSYYYYRINFTKKNVLGEIENMPILRNHRYIVIVNKVLGPGYESFDAALSAPSNTTVNGYLDVTIQELDETAGYGSVVFDGNFYLALNKAEFTVPRGGADVGNPLELRILTNYSADQSVGWKIDASDPWNSGVITGISGESLNGVSGPASVGATVGICVAPNETGSARNIKIKVKAGTLVQEVTISQAGTENRARLDVDVPAELDFLSFNGKMLDNGPKQIFLTWDSPDGICYIDSRKPDGFYYGFPFSPAYDDLTQPVSYTGGGRVLNIMSAPTASTSPMCSEITIRVKDGSQEITKSVTARHKNLFANMSFNKYYDADSRRPFIASSRVTQVADFKTNVSYAVSLSEDYNGLVTDFENHNHDMNDGSHDDPFSSQTYVMRGKQVSLANKSEGQMNANDYIAFKLEAKPYSTYTGTITEKYVRTVVPVAPHRTSHYIKKGLYSSAIPLSGAYFSAVGRYIDLSSNYSISVQDVSGTNVVSYYTYQTDPIYTPEAYVAFYGNNVGQAKLTVTQNGYEYSWNIYVTQ